MQEHIISFSSFFSKTYSSCVSPNELSALTLRQVSGHDFRDTSKGGKVISFEEKQVLLTKTR